jgi:hypothetical protein
VTITITGIQNPNYVANTTVCPTTSQPNCSFYGRVETFSTAALATAYVPSTSSPIDAGGVALSTAAQITVNAKVQETLAFCVWDNTGASTTCGGASTSQPTITLGNANGVLSSSTAYVNKDVEYSVQTNAGGSPGVSVQMVGTTLKNGTFSITQISGSPATSSTGTAQFGICTYTVTAGSGTLTPVANYNGVTAGKCAGTTDGASGDNGASFYLGTSVTSGSGFGDPIATINAGTTGTGEIAFLANIPVTQQPGLYTATEQLVADGTF